MLRVCSAAASKSVHKRDGLQLRGVPFKGFPCELKKKKKIIGKGKAGQLSEFQPLIKECLYFPRGESVEAVGKGSTLVLKRGCLGTILFFRCEEEPA